MDSHGALPQTRQSPRDRRKDARNHGRHLRSMTCLLSVDPLLSLYPLAGFFPPAVRIPAGGSLQSELAIDRLQSRWGVWT